MSDLIAEARYFQSKRVLNTRQMIINREHNPAISAKLVRKGVIGKAARLLQGNNARGEIFSLSDIVEDKTVTERRVVPTRHEIFTQRNAPSMLDMECIDNEIRIVIGIPLRYGGIGIREIRELADIEFRNSKSLSISILEDDTGTDQRSRRQSKIEQI
ncbi:hypothetical protein GJ496_004775 [Pomphorhynchus laevis]|nr:hypothetical protein GJ496_004775 [Pomphorhynchus laevis]